MPESRARIDNIEDGPDYLIEPKGKEVLKRKKKKKKNPHIMGYVRDAQMPTVY